VVNNGGLNGGKATLIFSIMTLFHGISKFVVKIQVFTAESTNMIAFWHITPYSFVEVE
jgi:hypothetical protein